LITRCYRSSIILAEVDTSRARHSVEISPQTALVVSDHEFFNNIPYDDVETLFAAAPAISIHLKAQ
jgi:hypothetical protein